MPQPRILSLSDGRRVSFAEFGAPAGQPIFLCHDTPGSYILRHPNDQLTRDIGIRLITIERPGFGFSDAMRHRQLLMWPHDLCAVADALGVEHFSLLGVGTGAAYALASAYQLPKARVRSVGLVNALAPLVGTHLLSGITPVWRRRYRWSRYGVLPFDRERDPKRYLHQYLEPFPASDKILLHKHPDWYSLWLEALHQGLLNPHWVQDIHVVARKWGFNVGDVTQLVYLWHGVSHPIMTPAMSRYMVALLPRSEHEFIPGAGYGVLYTYWEIILATLLGVNY